MHHSLSKRIFKKKLYEWHKSGARPHPWKSTHDPYRIWLSEIILQQTRVETGTVYYIKFVERFPSINDLANASLEEVYELWKGLGYYSRAKNLHLSAQIIMTEYQGVFPTKYEDILSLKGVGPYTAAAIASFAYDLPYPVVDGNVKRVISRYVGYEKNILASSAHSDILALLRDDIFDEKHPAKFNQAVMDFGATVCKPKGALCKSCLLRESCYAYKSDKVSVLPVRINKIKRKVRYFHFIVIAKGQSILFQQRTEKDIWQNLYQFPMIESSSIDPLQKEELLSYLEETFKIDIRATEIKMKGPLKQLLTHQKIIARFYHGISVSEAHDLPADSAYIWMKPDKYHQIAVPKTIDWYLNDNSISLFTLNTQE